MGNCNSNKRKAGGGKNDGEQQRYIGVEYSQDNMPGDMMWDSKEFRDPFSTEKLFEPTETTTSSSNGGIEVVEMAPQTPETASDFSLTPSRPSPESSTALVLTKTTTTPLTSPPLFPSGSYDAPIATVSMESSQMSSSEADDMLSPLTCTALVPASSSPRRRGRALQARLQKARYMQRALAAGQQQQSYDFNDNVVDTSTNGMRMMQSSSSSAANSQKQHRHRSWSNASTNSTADATSIGGGNGNGGNGDLESLTSSNALHAELKLDSPILCTALSRTTMIDSNSNDLPSSSLPPLHIAVGTESGSVVVQELLNDAERANNNTNFGISKPKLGLPVSVQLPNRIRSLDFSPDGQFLAVGGDDCRCTVYRLIFEKEKDEERASSSSLKSLEWVTELERVDRVYAVQFSPDSRFLAIGGFDGTVAILSTQDIGNELQLKPIVEIPRDGLVMSMDWSPDGRFLAVGGSDKCCAVIDCQKNAWTLHREIRRNATIQQVKWYPSGQYLAISTADKVSVLVGRGAFPVMKDIDLRRGKRERAIYRNNSICWSPNGSYLVVCGSDRNCTLYETRGFSVVQQLPRNCSITSVVWGQHGSYTVGGMLPRRFLVIGGEDRRVSILKAGLEPNMTSGSSIGGNDDLSTTGSLSYFSTRGEWVLKENLFRDADDEGVHSLANGHRQEVASPRPASKTMIAVAFSQGSKSRSSAYVAHSSDDGLVTVRYGTDWHVAAEIQFPKPVPTMAFSNGSRYLALGCEDSNVYIADTISHWELVAKIEFTAPISSLCFGSKNNERLAVGSVDGTMAFLDPKRGFDFAGEIDSARSPVTAADWSTKNLAVGREDGKVAVYNSPAVIREKYESAAELDRKCPVTALSFGVHSRFVAVGDRNGTVGIYSSKGNWVLCHQVDARRTLASVLWCPQGRHLAYANDLGALKVIDTVFWSDIREAESSAPPADESALSSNGNEIQSSLSFSQDGKMLALSRSDTGLVILDSTVKWKITFDLHGDEVECLSDTEVAPSSISSQEDYSDGGDEDDGGFEL